MKNIVEVMEKLEKIKPTLKEKFKVKSISIFGSYVGGKVT